MTALDKTECITAPTPQSVCPMCNVNAHSACRAITPLATTLLDKIVRF